MVLKIVRTSWSDRFNWKLNINPV